MAARIALKVVLPFGNACPTEWFDDEGVAVNRALALVSPLYGQVSLTRNVGPSSMDFDMRHIVWEGRGVRDKGWRVWRDGVPATGQLGLFV